VKYQKFIDKLAGNFGKYKDLMENKFRAMIIEEKSRSSQSNRESEEKPQFEYSRGEEIKDKLQGEFMERIEAYEQEIEGLKGVMMDYDDMKAQYRNLSSEHGNLLMEYHDLRKGSKIGSDVDGQEESQESSAEQVHSLKGMMGTLESKIASWKFTPARFYIDQ